MTETILANFNGIEQPLNEVRVSVMDRSFLFGDAVYEVLRLYGGRPFLRQEHFTRLRRSLAELRIETDLDRLEARMDQTIAASNVTDGVVYIHVSRGEAPQRSHAPPVPPPQPNELIFVRPLPRRSQEQTRRGVHAITFPDVRWKRCDIKSVNLLGNVLAAQAAADAQCDEAILVTPEGTISEGSHTSVFGVRDGAILTAPLEANVLPGITRNLVVQLAQAASIPLREETLSVDALTSIDELFLTGTTMDVCPVLVVDGKPIGTGHPGSITLRLASQYQDRIEAHLTSSP